MKNSNPDTFYDDAIAAIKADPEGIIRERRIDQIAALKLMIPEQIRAHRKLRRKSTEQFEAAQKESESRKIDIALAVKSEVDSITGKAKYHNKELRESEILSRTNGDAEYQSWWRYRNNMYADMKGIDDEIDYLVRIDLSLVEILAMMTASIEYETSFKRSVTKNGRTGNRASNRAANAAGIGIEAEAAS